MSLLPARRPAAWRIKNTNTSDGINRSTDRQVEKREDGQTVSQDRERERDRGRDSEIEAGRQAGRAKTGMNVIVRMSFAVHVSGKNRTNGQTDRHSVSTDVYE